MCACTRIRVYREVTLLEWIALYYKAQVIFMGVALVVALVCFIIELCSWK